MEFVRESIMRADYTMATLNPDDPKLPVYREYINRCRPLPQWAADTPREIMTELKEPAHPGWVHWFFSFADNYGLTEAKKRQIIGNVPPGTKLYKNKILGLRGRATGLVFSNFERQRHCISRDRAKALVRQQKNRNQTEWFARFSAALDTSYSQQSPDTIAMSFIGITNLGRCVLLSERVYNNAQLREPLAPSDTVREFRAFLDRNRQEWGLARTAFVDSADAATLREWDKYQRQNGSIYAVAPAWKKMTIIDRIHHQLGWFAHGDFLVVGGCCKWCSDLAGTYFYPNVPKDVYRRHERCRCLVEYDPGSGRRQNVHTKQWTEDAEPDKIKARRTIGQTAQRQFQSEALLQKHYRKHLEEFGNISIPEYVARATTAADRELSSDVVQLIRSDGSTSKYCFSTNEFVVTNRDGTLRTYFLPKDKEAYWDDELKRNE